MSLGYASNSSPKDIIRKKWVELSKQVIERNKSQDSFSLLTLPSKDLTDILTYGKEGIITLEKTETGSLKLVGDAQKIVCVEKSQSIWMEIIPKLSKFTLRNSDVGTLILAEPKLFPFDTINLDFDGCLSKQQKPFDTVIGRMFTYQKEHRKDFSFYLTFPETEQEDEEAHKRLLKDTLTHNLSDRSNQTFIDNYTKLFSTNIDSITYENLSIISLAKIIIRNSSSAGFKVKHCEFFVYGGGSSGRHRMISLLFDFEFVGTTGHTQLYYDDVVKALNESTELS